MIRFYPDGPIEGYDPGNPSFYLTPTGIVYRIKESNYDHEVGAFFSPTLQRWIKGKLTGYTVSALTRNFIATMDKLEEATLIGDGVNGLKFGTEEFKMKMFLLADEVVERKDHEIVEEGDDFEEPTSTIPPPAPPSNNYLDDLVKYQGGEQADWNEISRKSITEIRGTFSYVALRNDVIKKDVLAKIDSTGNLDNTSVIGAISFGIDDDYVMFGFQPEGGELEIPDQEVSWVLDYLGVRVGHFLEEEAENSFTSSFSMPKVKAALIAMGIPYDPSIEI